MPRQESSAEEDEPQEPYYQAARFSSEQRAGRAYFQAQDAILKIDCDLSAYRLRLNQIWHVAVLGSAPPEPLDRSLRRILASGQPTSLPDDVLTALLERRAQQTKLGSWVERHYRPGQPL